MQDNPVHWNVQTTRFHIRNAQASVQQQLHGIQDNLLQKNSQVAILAWSGQLQVILDIVGHLIQEQEQSSF